MSPFFLYLLPVHEEDELVRSGPGPGPGLHIGLGKVHAACVLSTLSDVNDPTAAALRVDPPQRGVSFTDLLLRSVPLIEPKVGGARAEYLDFSLE